MSDFIKQQIERKNNYNIPYYATKNSITHTMTDMDHFPYTRYFRGVYNQSKPVVMDREAGFRARQDNCYKPVMGGNYKSLNEPHLKFHQPAHKVIPMKADTSIPDAMNDTSCEIASKLL